MPGGADMAEGVAGAPAAGRSRGRGAAGRQQERERARADAAERLWRDPEGVARELCLAWLTMRPHTRSQLAAKLRRREIPAEAAEAVLARFDEVGLVDDRAFATAWVESRHAGRGLARRALASELRARGVAGDTVDEAVGELDPVTEAATARALVDRRLRGMQGLAREVQTRRLLGLLARKGYGGGTAARTVREALDAAGDDGVLADARADLLLRVEEDAPADEG